MPSSEQPFRQLAENLRDAVWIASPDGGKLVYVSPAFERLWGRPVQEAYELPALWLDSVHPEDRDRVASSFFANARAGGAAEEYRIVRPDGEVRWIRNRAYPVRDDDGVVYRVVGIAEDVTESRRITERLSYQASHDPLTGLINRVEFERRLHRVFDSSRRERVEHALCYLDLDRFKVVNDTWGHMAGDELLRQLGDVLGGQSRRRDTLARLGGDEFGILMEHCSLGQARRVADKLHRAISAFRFDWNGQTFSVGASIGLVPINDRSASVTAILSAADSACYAAKNAGRNRIHVVAEGEPGADARRGEARWVDRIKDALAADRLVLHYLPIAPIRDPGRRRQLSFRSMAPGGRPARERARFELLVRMLDDDGRIVPPGAFLPAAERYDLAPEIDRWVVDTALGNLAGDRGRLARIGMCFVNLSGGAIRDLAFPEFVAERIAASGVPPRRICFEIAESTAVASLRATTHCVKALRDVGCRVALDDFGSGPSAFTYLRRLPVDYLKIDGHFVREVENDPVNRVTVKAINDIAHATGKRTVAKSVESQGTLEVLQEIGVDFAQGFGIGRPEPVETLSDPVAFRPVETIENVL